MKGESWTNVRYILLLFCLFKSESLPKINKSAWWIFTELYFRGVNLDPNVFEKRWTDGQSWHNDIVEKVNIGEDLRWVGSRCPLTHALGIRAGWDFFFSWRETCKRWSDNNLQNFLTYRWKSVLPHKISAY